MHVLLVTQYWEPEEGVVQRRYDWITRGLIARGHHLSVIAPPPHYPTGKVTNVSPRVAAGAVDTSRPGVTVYRCDCAGHTTTLSSRVKDQAVIMFSQMLTARRAVSAARKACNPIDVVVATTPALPQAFVAYGVSLVSRLPLVVELRDAWPELLGFFDQWTDPLPTSRSGLGRMAAAAKRLAFHLLLRCGGAGLNWVIRRADAVITTTTSLANLERQKGCSRVVAVRNRAGEDVPPCAGHRVHTGPLRVLYAGTIGRAQGLSNAVRAAHLAQKEGALIDLRIIGGGAHRGLLEKTARQLGVKVSFVPRIPHAAMPSQYEWADTVLVHLQSWKPMEYTIPSKLFEAMRAGKHISAAVAGEAADIVTSSCAGDVVEPMNPTALARLWVSLYEDRSRLDVGASSTRWLAAQGDDDALADRWIDTVSGVSHR